jgi:hypothetical protein
MYRTACCAQSLSAMNFAARTTLPMAAAVRHERSSKYTMNTRGHVAEGRRPTTFACFARLTIDCWQSETSARSMWNGESASDAQSVLAATTESRANRATLSPAHFVQQKWVVRQLRSLGARVVRTAMALVERHLSECAPTRPSHA